MSAPDNASTIDEGRTEHPLYAARMARLEALKGALGFSPGLDLNDQTALAIKAALARVERGTR